MVAPSRRLRAGDPAVGFIEPTNRGARSAHLVGWDLSALEALGVADTRTLPPPHWGLNRDVFFDLPHLAEN